MNESRRIQREIFAMIRQSLPPNISFVHEVSELLGISYDSAYRRIRGEKELSLSELVLICSKYDISLDAMFEEIKHKA